MRPGWPKKQSTQQPKRSVQAMASSSLGWTLAIPLAATLRSSSRSARGSVSKASTEAAMPASSRLRKPSPQPMSAKVQAGLMKGCMARARSAW